MSATPGPWNALAACRYGWYVASASEPSVVIDTTDVEGRYGAIAREADAKLIAAAPDLADALFGLLAALGGIGLTRSQSLLIAEACEAGSQALIKSGRVMG